MKTKLINFIKAIVSFLERFKWWIIGSIAAACFALIAVIVVCHLIVASNDKYVISIDSKQHARIGIVLGAGVNKDGVPYKELKSRLDIAAEALQKGQVDKLILSGDNRFYHYNEPMAMQAYLEQVKHIDPSKLQPDFAGRSTYESCERASKIFGVKKAIIYSASSHVPRAIYLCRHFGIEAYGVGASVNANNSRRREALADVKALINIYIHGEPTILGSKIPV